MPPLPQPFQQHQHRPCKRDGKQKRIEAVEKTAVAGEQTSGILDPDAAFEHTFHEVALVAEYGGYCSDAEPLREGISWINCDTHQVISKAPKATARARLLAIPMHRPKALKAKLLVLCSRDGSASHAVSIGLCPHFPAKPGFALKAKNSNNPTWPFLIKLLPDTLTHFYAVQKCGHPPQGATGFCFFRQVKELFGGLDGMFYSFLASRKRFFPPMLRIELKKPPRLAKKLPAFLIRNRWLSFYICAINCFAYSIKRY
jgi:hypothetical protein